MKRAYHYTHQLDGTDETSPERVDIVRHEVSGDRDIFISIYDDADEIVTFYADQIDDLIEALNECKKYRKGIEYGEKVNAENAAREA